MPNKKSWKEKTQQELIQTQVMKMAKTPFHLAAVKGHKNPTDELFFQEQSHDSVLNNLGKG
jgi:hypothetical protein